MDSPNPAPTDPRRRIALVAAVYLGSFIATLDVSIVNVALPTLQRALATDLAGLQWVIDIYALCLSAFILSAGPVGDRYGRKRAWLAGVVVFTLGSAMCAMAGNLSTLLAGRAVQGVAGALMIPGALSLLAHAFPEPASRARVIGGWSSFTALSLILGPMLGGLLVDHAGWQSIFLINLPIGVLTVGLGLWGIRESSHPEHAALDPLGQVLSVLWLGALTYGLIAAGEYGWGSGRAATALVAAAIGLALFLMVEARVARPLLPLALFRDARFSATNFASFVLGFSSYASLFFFSLFLQQVQGWSPSDTGWRLGAAVRRDRPHRLAVRPAGAALRRAHADGRGLRAHRHLDAAADAVLGRNALPAAGAAVRVPRRGHGLGGAVHEHGGDGLRARAALGHGLGHDERAAPGRHADRHRAPPHADEHAGDRAAGHRARERQGFAMRNRRAVAAVVAA
jgi:MFS family permease